MLLDRRQTPWAVATVAVGVIAVAVYVWLDRRGPAPLTGGSTVGLWYGVAGSALMIYAGLLSAHRLFPAWWWLGMRKTWLRGHLWLGSLSVVLIACHAHARLGSGVALALWLVLAGIILTGVYGLVLQQVLPGWLARRFPDEAPIGQIPHLCRLFREEADELVDQIAPPEAAKAADAGGGFAAEFRAFHEEQFRPFLAAPALPRSVLLSDLQAEALFSAFRRRAGVRHGDASDPAAAALDRLEAVCRDRRRLAEQERMYRWLHAWLLLHVPLSAALLILGAAHVVMSLYY
ncbi:MAG TPA: hypothetical protein VGF55_10090 [Gemmataceae bacterium]